MLKKRWLRLAIGTVLGGLAGLSLTSSILPMIYSGVGLIEDLFVRWRLADYASHAVFVWAVGGWAVARAGFPLAGAVIMGLLGMASGGLLCLAGLGNEWQLLLTGLLGGGAYGAVGGMILGSVLRPPLEDEAVGEAPDDKPEAGNQG